MQVHHAPGPGLPGCMLVPANAQIKGETLCSDVPEKSILGGNQKRVQENNKHKVSYLDGKQGTFQKQSKTKRKNNL